MSARNLSNFAESAMAVNRVIQQHFSMRYSYLEPAAPLRASKSCQPGGPPLGLSPPGEPPLGLSPPGDSELLRRRHSKLLQVH